MVLQKRKNVLAKYGIALASLFVVPEVQADIVEISWDNGFSFVSFFQNGSPGSSKYGNPGQPANIDQLGTNVDFCVFYTQFNNGPYGSMTFFNRGFEVVNKSIVGIAEVQAGEILDPDSFVAQSKKNFDIKNGGFVGFVTGKGNVGWFKIDLTSCLCFTEGKFANQGEVLPVGELMGDVNCDGLVNLLDVGPFVELLSNGSYSIKADFDENASVDLLDVEPFVNALSGN